MFNYILVHIIAGKYSFFVQLALIKVIGSVNNQVVYIKGMVNQDQHSSQQNGIIRVMSKSGVKN